MFLLCVNLLNVILLFNLNLLLLIFSSFVMKNNSVFFPFSCYIIAIILYTLCICLYIFFVLHIIIVFQVFLYGISI